MALHIFRDSVVGQLTRQFYCPACLRYDDELLLGNTSTKSSTDNVAKESNDSVADCLGKSIQIQALPCGLQSLTGRTLDSDLVPSSEVSLNDQLPWTHEGDLDNPWNWPTGKKCFVAGLICFYTFVVYLGSSIILGSIPYIMLKYDIAHTLSSLTIATYVFGYGLGALIFSPLSEIKSVGRNIPYIASFACFVLISGITAMCDSFASLVVLRFLQGFFGSPALATGAASMTDMFQVQYLPLAFLGWMGAAILGPALGPTISVYSIQAESWRFPLWEMLYISAFVFVLLAIALPETLHAKILHDRGIRNNLIPTGPTAKAKLWSGFKQLLAQHLYQPTKIMLTHRAVAFANLYTCLIYALYYTFFECLPRVYLYRYGFTGPEVGLSFLSIASGAILGTVMLLPWTMRWIRADDEKTSPPRSPQRSLIPALYASVVMPFSLLLFAWTSSGSVHWIVSLLGVAGYTACMFTILQCLANYLILVHPDDAASLFAGNDFMRATTAAGAVVASHPMYDGLRVSWGVTLLAGLTLLCTFGLFWLYRSTPRLYGQHPVVNRV